MENIRQCLQTSNPDFQSLWDDICDEAELKESKWVAHLRKGGIKAAHPDDGWVNRKNNEVHLAYPQFDDGIDIGCTIALGDPGEYRLVKIIGYRKSMIGMVWWFFIEK